MPVKKAEPVADAEFTEESSMALVAAGSQDLTTTGGLTRDQIDLLKRTVCRGASDDELDLFINVCNQTRLNPFAKQVYAIQRWDSRAGRNIMSLQISVDGLRVIAQRSGMYAGQIGPEWCGQDGNWRDLWVGPGFPFAARVGVLRKDFQQPLYAVAKWDSYAATDKSGNLTSIWEKLPDMMLGKVAESNALRRAFPAELSGLYSPEEMEQANNTVPARPAARLQAPPTYWQTMTRVSTTPEGRQTFMDECVKLGVDGQYVCALYGVTKLMDLPATETFSAIIAKIKESQEKKEQ